MAKKIQKFTKGDRGRTLMHSGPANELVDAVNSLSNWNLTPSWIGYVLAVDDAVTLDLSPLESYVMSLEGFSLASPPTSGGYAYTSVDGDQAWRQYVQLGSGKAFFGLGGDGYHHLTIKDNGAYITLEQPDASHAAGLHTAYLDFDQKAYFGHLSSTGEYGLTLEGAADTAGLHPTYLELCSQKVFLGYSSLDGSFHLELPVDGNIRIGSIDYNKVWLGKGGDGTYHLEIKDSYGYVKITDKWFGGYANNCWQLSMIDASAYIQLGASSAQMTITGATVSTNAANGGFYVGNSKLENKALTLDNDGGVYIGSASLTAGALTIGYVGISGSCDIEGDCSVASNLDAESISTRSFSPSYLGVSGSCDIGGNCSVAGNLDAGSISTSSFSPGYLGVSGSCDIGGNCSVGGNLSTSSLSIGSYALTLQSVTVCVNGTTKTMRVLGTTPT